MNNEKIKVRQKYQNITRWVKSLSDQKKSSKVKNYFGGFFAYKLQAHSPFPSVTGYPQIGRGK